MPRQRSAANQGLPARWSIREGSTTSACHQARWRVGRQEVPATRRPADRLRGLRRQARQRECTGPDGAGSYPHILFDRYLREVSPRKAPRSLLNDQNSIKPLRRVVGDVPIKEPFRVAWCHQYVEQRGTPAGAPAPIQAARTSASCRRSCRRWSSETTCSAIP